MASPFQHLTVDGQALEGAAIGEWADALVSRGRGSAWASDVRSTLRELVDGDGSMSVHTSGTTGAPKPMRISASDLLASVAITRAEFGLKEGDRALLCLPCEFIGGKMMLVRAMVAGLDLHLIDPRGGVLRNLRSRDRFDFTTMVPMQLHTALQHDRERVEEQFGTILLGGGPISQELIERVRELRVNVVMGYGSTETVTHVAACTLSGPNAADRYTALGEVRFSGDENGCLVVHAPHLEMSEQTTHDIVELIDDRHFRWLGRHDNVILSGGRKIHPERLEAMTAGVVPYPHFFVAVPDERLGQGVALVLETGGTSRDPAPGVIESLKGMLYEHERPKRVIAVEDFVRTGSGKVDRRATLSKITGN